MKNLLFIFTDEQAVNTMKAYGNDLIHTPHLDRLAEQSIVFERAYVTQPVCTPSRSTLLTGLFPHTNGCTENNKKLPDHIKCFPELADFEGYRKAYHGKWHLGNEIFCQHGFREWKSIEDYFYCDYYDADKDKSKSSTYHNYLMEKGYEPDQTLKDGVKAFSREFCARLPEGDTKAAYVADVSVDFLNTIDEDPFILFVNFLEPHMPFFGPRDQEYAPCDMPLPHNYEDIVGKLNPSKLALFKDAYFENGHSGLDLKTEDDWKRMIANYWGLVSLVDAQVGKIMESLEANGLMEDTIIVFTSDHGDMMGSHRLLAKCTMYEEAVRVPYLLKIPDLECAGKRVASPVSQVDIVPTLLDCMGQGIPAHLEGQSWLPHLKNQEPLKEEDVFIEWNGYNNGFGDILKDVTILPMWLKNNSASEVKGYMGDPIRTVITPDLWKYNWSSIGEDELYNLKEDPYEKINLVSNEAYKERIQSLRDKIKAWKIRTTDINPSN